MRRVTKLAAVVATAALALAACGGSSSGGTTTGSGSPAASTSGAAAFKVGLAYDIGGRGDKSFNDAAAAGLDKANAELGVEIKELSASLNETAADKEARLTLLAQSGYNPVIAVGFLYGTPLKTVAAKFPATTFGIIDSNTTGANVTGLLFAEEQGSFLVGAAAALKSKAGSVGYIGGCLLPSIQKFEAGFTAGAKAVKSDIKVQVKYLSNPPECKGFTDPAAGAETASGMYDAGADIIFAAAGGSGTGVFQAAKAKQKLAIGVDSDQYQSAAEDLKPVILTSMLKRVDTAVFDFIKSKKDGTPLTGDQIFDLKQDGVGYSKSGGQVDDIATKLDEYKAKIISGEITVPTVPAK